MRLILDDMIHELKLRLEENKGIRSRVLLKDALGALQKLKESERQF